MTPVEEVRVCPLPRCAVRRPEERHLGVIDPVHVHTTTRQVQHLRELQIDLALGEVRCLPRHELPSDPEGIGERHEPESHAIPLALFTLLGRREGFKIFGTDWETRDGSCLRDYVHVLDLADAHVRAVERLLGGGASLAANLGTGDGVTVLELLAAVEKVTGKRVPAASAPRRDGDSPALLADNSLARRELGWTPERDINQIVADAWKWHSEVEAKVFD